MQAPPHNLQAEQAVLAAMLLEQEAVVKATAILKAEDFYREEHKVIFTAMQELLNKGQRVELITLHAYLAEKQQLEPIGGLAYLFALERSTPTAANVAQHAGIVKNEALKRQLLRYGHEVMINASGTEESATQLEQALQGLSAIMNSQDSGAFEDLRAMLTSYLDKISSRDPNAKGCTGISTGFAKLDALTNGFQNTDFIILAARPSMGKTAMVLNFIENMLLYEPEKNYKIGLFSMEMSKHQLLNRMTSSITDLDSKRLESNRLDKAEWDLIWQATDILATKQLYIDDTGGLSLAMLCSRARRLKLEKGLDILFIDYLQLMTSSSKSQDRQQVIADISRALKALARELNIPIIALSQLSRAVESRQTKRPIMSDLRESGSLEQDADLVMFLYRDDYYFKENSQEPGVTELILAKHRNGDIGTLKFYFEKQHTRFIELF